MNLNIEDFSALADTINNATATIEACDRQIAELRARTSGDRRTLDELRRSAEFNVNSATDEKGKSLYSNAEARKSAAASELDKDPAARSLRDAIDQAENMIAALEVDRDHASRTRQNQLAFLSYLSSWNLYHQPVPQLVPGTNHRIA